MRQTNLIHGSAKLLFGQVFFAGGSYLTLIIIARAAGVEVFGQYIFAVSVLAWVEHLLAESFIHPMLNYMARSKLEQVRRLQIIQLIVAAVGTALMMLAAPTLSSLSHDSQLALIFFIAALDILPFTACRMIDSLLNALDDYSGKFWVTTVYGLGKVVFMGGAAFVFGSASSIFAGMILASVFACGVAWWFYRKHRDKRIRSSANQSTLRCPFSYSIVSVTGIGLMLAADIWVLQGSDVGAAQVGEYGAAQNLGKLMFFGATAVMSTMLPTIARTSAGIEDSLQANQIKYLWAILIGGLVFSAASFSAIAEWLIALLYGPEFSLAPSVLQLLAPAYAVLVLGMICGQIMLHTGRGARGALSFAIGAALLPIGSWLGLQSWGIIGAPLGAAVAGLVLIIANGSALSQSLGCNIRAK